MRDGVAGNLIFDLSGSRSRNKCACGASTTSWLLRVFFLGTDMET